MSIQYITVKHDHASSPHVLGSQKLVINLFFRFIEKIITNYCNVTNSQKKIIVKYEGNVAGKDVCP